VPGYVQEFLGSCDSRDVFFSLVDRNLSAVKEHAAFQLLYDSFFSFLAAEQKRAVEIR
jgi:hypothetical protein